MSLPSEPGGKTRGVKALDERVAYLSSTNAKVRFEFVRDLVTLIARATHQCVAFFHKALRLVLVVLLRLFPVIIQRKKRHGLLEYRIQTQMNVRRKVELTQFRSLGKAPDFLCLDAGSMGGNVGTEADETFVDVESILMQRNLVCSTSSSCLPASVKSGQCRDKGSANGNKCGCIFNHGLRLSSVACEAISRLYPSHRTKESYCGRTRARPVMQVAVDF
jgi:hypothetical protein